MPKRKGTKTMKDKEEKFGESFGAVCGASSSPYIMGVGGERSGSGCDVSVRGGCDIIGIGGERSGSGCGARPVGVAGTEDGGGLPGKAAEERGIGGGQGSGGCAARGCADGAGDGERLSPHFTLAEMTRSGVALRHGIANRPGREEVESLRRLCVAVLEPLRRRVGRVLVTSGFRCRELNARVGGAEGSQHVRGEAADLYVSSAEQARKYAAIIMAHSDFDQLILEPLGSARKRWIHVSHASRRGQRRQVLGL